MESEDQSRYTENLQRVLEEVFPSTDPLDSPNFDPIAYINAKYPDEQSLFDTDRKGTLHEPHVTLPDLLKQLQRRILVLQDEISKSVRHHSCQRMKTKKAITDAREAIQELFCKIKAIKSKAEGSEKMVKLICSDIKSLDYAKQHLTATITASKRLHMLVSAVDQLQYVANKKQYREAAQLLEAVADLFTHFEDYSDIAQIDQLKITVEETKAQLKRIVFRDFFLFDPTVVTEGLETTISMLNDGCAVVDVLGEVTTDELVDTFLAKRVKEYRDLFKPGSGEAATLEKAERRYHWLHRQLSTYEDTYAKIFPEHWRVGLKITRKFCVITRDHLGHILTSLKNADALDTNIVISQLQRALEFERSMSIRFHPTRNVTEGTDSVDHQSVVEAIKAKYRMQVREQERGRRGGRTSAKKTLSPEEQKALEKMCDLTGLLSSVFMGYLDGYVGLERMNIRELLEKIEKEEKWEAEDDVKRKDRLAGSDEFFVYIKKSLQRCQRLTTGKVLFAIAREYQIGLRCYCDMLMRHLPDERKEFNLTAVKTLAININTAQYCQETTEPLAMSVRRAIDAEFKDKVDFADEVDRFAAALNKAISAFVAAVNAKILRVLVGMTKLPWASWELVGDESNFVAQIHAIYKTDVIPIAGLVDTTYHQYLCSQLAKAFCGAFIEHVYKCKRINELGAQQLSLDAHVLKTKVLLELPNLGFSDSSEHRKGPSRAFKRMVTRDMGTTESLLKVLVSPKDRILITFRTLLPKIARSQEGVETLLKILELRGFKKNEQQELVALFNPSAPAESSTSTSNRLKSLFKF